MSNVVGAKSGAIRAALQMGDVYPVQELQAYMDSVLRSEIMRRRLVRGAAGAAELSVYGAFGIQARTMEVIVYDNPSLLKKIPTAFTDGHRTFFSAPFLQEALEGVDAAGQRKVNKDTALFILLHEYAHVMFGHTHSRLSGYAFSDDPRQDAQIKNIIFDSVINPRIAVAFPHLAYNDIVKTAWGMKDVERFGFMSEEEAASLYLKDPKAFCEAAKGSGGPESKGAGSSGDGGDKSGQGQGADGQEGPSGQGKPGGSAIDQLNDSSDSHIVDSQELSEILEEAGLERVRDMLGLPDSKDTEGHKKLGEEALRRVAKALQERGRELKAASDAGVDPSQMAGAHMDNFVREALNIEKEPKLSWMVALSKLFDEIGTELVDSDDQPHDLFFAEDGLMNMEVPYIPGVVPMDSSCRVAILVDSSGSMSSDMLEAVIAETYGIVSNSIGDRVSVDLYWADTALRGECVEINTNNVEEVLRNSPVDVLGRGGTDIQGVLMQLMAHAKDNGKRYDAVLYCTDLFDQAPGPGDWLKDAPQIVFLYPNVGQESHADNFRNAVASFAEVVEITQGEIVELTRDKAAGARLEEASLG